MTSETIPSELQVQQMRDEIEDLKKLLNRWLGEQDWMQGPGEPDSDGHPTLAEPDLSGHSQLESDTMDAVTPDAPDPDDFDDDDYNYDGDDDETLMPDSAEPAF